MTQQIRNRTAHRQKQTSQKSNNTVNHRVGDRGRAVRYQQSAVEHVHTAPARFRAEATAALKRYQAGLAN